MDGLLKDDMVLPPLRQDLRLLPSGAGIWKIHDPLAQRYFELDQDAVDLLSCWQQAGTVGGLRRRVASRGGRLPSEKSVAMLLQFLERNELLAARPQATYARMRMMSGKPVPWWKRVLHGYLYFRVPLARPDAFLRRTLPFVAWAFHPAFWIAVALAALAGLFLLSRQWEAFLATFPRMFDAAGFMTFGVSLLLVKTLHELGHGYTCVRLGSRVTTMGVAMIVMTPIAYTDTTDAWRLTRRRDRVLIDIAGMAVEVLIAVIATLVWVFVEDGPVRTAAFALATTGWVMSIAVNMSPLMRFDGYYLFSDLTGVPNLQERSFAMARWWTRETLFGYGDAPPEAADRFRKLWFIVYAWIVWIYRFFVFAGIALLVYHFFFKILGIFMFGIEVGWFIALPIWREVSVWLHRRRDAKKRVRLTFAVLAVLLLAFLLPWPYTLRIPAVLTAASQAPAYAPRPARIEKILAQPGATVKAGQVLMTLSAPALDDALARSEETARGIEERMARRAADAQDLSDSLVLARQLRMERERAVGLRAEQARLTVRAPIAGTVIDMAQELHPGRWIDDKTRLALVAAPGTLQARGYIDGNELARLDIGRAGRFVDDARLQPALDVSVSRIAAAASESLEAEALLSSLAGGTLPTRHDGKAIKPEFAAFEIVAAVQGAVAAPPLTEVRGELQVRGRAQSLAQRVLRRVVQVLVRESVL